MHVYPALGEGSGANQTCVYGLTPFVFLDHQDNLASLTTFAHEWGQGLHTNHGTDAGEMTAHPQYCQEWDYIPHFERPFNLYR